MELLAIGYENCNILILKVSLPRYFKKKSFQLISLSCNCGFAGVWIISISRLFRFRFWFIVFHMKFVAI